MPNSMNEYLKFSELKIYILHLIMLIKRHKLKISLFSLFTAVIAVLMVTFQKPVYNAKLSFLLNENDPGMSLNLSSLAGLAGISGLNNGVNVSEDKLIFLANSRTLIGSALLCKSNLNGVNDLLVNHYIFIFKLQKSFKKDTALENFEKFTNDKINQLTYQENKVLDKIIKQISDQKKYTVEVKKKTGIVAQWAGIVTIAYKDINEDFAKVFVDSLYGKLSDYYTQKSINKQLKNYYLIKHRADSIYNLLTNAEYRGASLADENIKLFKMKGRLGIERAKRDVEMLTLMYAEVIKNLEMAKFNLDNQTPVFQVVDKPTFPLSYKKTSKLLAGIAGLLVGYVLCIIYLSVKYKREG